MGEKSGGVGTGKRAKQFNLNCLYMNARSLMNKIDDFKAEIVSRDPDIIGITETWGHKDVFDSEIMSMTNIMYIERIG